MTADDEFMAGVRARADVLVTFPGNAEAIINGIDAFRLAREDVPRLLGMVERRDAALTAVLRLCDSIEATPPPGPRRGLSNRAKARLTRRGHGISAARSLARQFRAAVTDAMGEATT